MRLSGGRYSLGPKIIALDHTIRQSDPLLRVAAPVMADLVRRTGCACVLSALLGDQILDTHRESGAEPLTLAYGRGRPRPMFYGAAPKAILANQPTAWLHKLYDARSAEIAPPVSATTGRRFAASCRRSGATVSMFRAANSKPICQQWRRPIRAGSPEAHSALALVTSSERFELLNVDQLARLVIQGVADIGAMLQA